MKKILFLVLGVFTLLVFSCSNNKEFVPVFRGEIDEGDWINTHTIGKYGGVKRDYCSKIDSVYQYSYGFKKLVKEISPKPVKKIKTVAWVKLEDLNKKTLLVVSLGKDDKNISWSGHEINPIIKEVNKWYKVEFEDTFPEYDSEGAYIEVYVFNPNKNIAYVDDFEISFFEEE